MATLTREQIWERLNALADYELSMLGINEDSDAADREYERVLSAKSKLMAMLRSLTSSAKAGTPAEPPIRPNDDPPEQVRAREEAERRHQHRHDAEKQEQFLDVLAEAKRVVKSGQGAGASDELFRKISEWSDDEFFRALAAFEYERKGAWR